MGYLSKEKIQQKQKEAQVQTQTREKNMQVQRNNAKQEEKKQIRTIAVAIRVPEDLNERLNNFIETKAMRRESKNYCFLEGLKMYLDKREKE